MPPSYQFIKVSTRLERVCVIELHRPKELNALSPGLLKEVARALSLAEEDSVIRAVILTGSGELGVFAAGADIKGLNNLTAESIMLDKGSYLSWDTISNTAKPMIAAIHGYALGGGCELAMLCDVILATDTSRFGQPEIKLGVLPGAGGTQRFTKAMGKSRAMELVLTGDLFEASEALERGLVSRLYPTYEALMAGALLIADRISGMDAMSVKYTKRAVLESFEVGLSTGLRAEQSYLIRGLLNNKLDNGDEEDDEEDVKEDDEEE